jgi:hypothetical protein
MSTLLNTVSDFEVIGYSLDAVLSMMMWLTVKQIFLSLTLCQKKDGIAVIKEFAKRISL